MINYIIIAVLLAIVGAIVFFLVREKKRGVSCIGCPHAANCKEIKCSTGPKPKCGCMEEQKSSESPKKK